MSLQSPPPGFCQDCAISCGLDRDLCGRCATKRKDGEELLARVQARLNKHSQAPPLTSELAALRRELLTLSETLSATTIMATARRLRELGEGA